MLVMGRVYLIVHTSCMLLPSFNLLMVEGAEMMLLAFHMMVEGTLVSSMTLTSDLMTF